MPQVESNLPPCDLQLRLCGSVLTNSPNQFLPLPAARTATRKGRLDQSINSRTANVHLRYQIFALLLLERLWLTTPRPHADWSFAGWRPRIYRSHPCGRNLFGGGLRLDLNSTPESTSKVTPCNKLRHLCLCQVKIHFYSIHL